MTAQPTPKGAWKITFLLFLFMLVNFADKVVVGLAGAPIMEELKLTPEQFGVLGCRTPRQQHKPAQHLAEQQIEQSQGHASIIVAR